MARCRSWATAINHLSDAMLIREPNANISSIFLRHSPAPAQYHIRNRQLSTYPRYSHYEQRPDARSGELLAEALSPALGFSLSVLLQEVSLAAKTHALMTKESRSKCGKRPAPLIMRSYSTSHLMQLDKIGSCLRGNGHPTHNYHFLSSPYQSLLRQATAHLSGERFSALHEGNHARRNAPPERKLPIGRL